MRYIILTAVVAVSLYAPAASAAVFHQYYADPVAAGTIGGVLNPGDAFVAQTTVRTPAPSITQTTRFTPGVSNAGIAGSLRWAVADTVRLIGVNLDLFDSNGNLVGSDTFNGLIGSYAVSSFNTGPLTAGEEYELVMTGVGTGLSFANLVATIKEVPASPDLTLGPLPPPPVQPLTFSPRTLTASGSVAQPLMAGDALLIDALLPAGGAMSHSFAFSLGEDLDLSLRAAWVVSDVVRLVGFNFDIFDASNNLVVSDSFQGLVGESAISRLDVSSLTVGQTYELRVTGNSTGIGDYNLFLSTGPGSPPTPIPLPASDGLVAIALGALLIARRGGGMRRRG